MVTFKSLTFIRSLTFCTLEIFNLFYRCALGVVTLEEQCPAIDSYYGFRRKICEYEEKNGVNLFDKCFKQITRAQAVEYCISGKAIRKTASSFP